MLATRNREKSDLEAGCRREGTGCNKTRSSSEKIFVTNLLSFLVERQKTTSPPAIAHKDIRLAAQKPTSFSMKLETVRDCAPIFMHLVITLAHWYSIKRCAKNALWGPVLPIENVKEVLKGNVGVFNDLFALFCGCNSARDLLALLSCMLLEDFIKNNFPRMRGKLTE